MDRESRDNSSQENEIRGKRNGQTKKPNKDSAARRYRAERRRRRKNRERKRGRKRARNGEKNGEARSRASKLKRRMNDAPAALLLGKIDGHAADDATNVTWRGANRTRSSGTDVTSPSNLQDQLTTEAAKATQTTSRYNTHEDTVEREFSKQLEKEISRTQMEDPASLENRILGSSVPKSSRKNWGRKEGEEEEKEVEEGGNEAKFGNSRYDAEKMLGYSRTEEDLPILDLENEVLARTLKDYNAYMTSSLRLSMVARRGGEVERRRAGGGSHFHGKPIIDEAELDRLGGGKKSAEWGSSSTVVYEDDTRGDLSCINGTFVPAPLARHALIKYVK